MFIPDLEEFPSRHPPSPYNIPLLIRRGEEIGCGLLPEGTIIRAVGWLGDQVLSSGEVEEKCIDRLMCAYEDRRIFSDGLMGAHRCEICREEQHCAEGKSTPIVYLYGHIFPLNDTLDWHGRTVQIYGHGHYLVQRQNVVYMAPALLLHYILEHHYRPPDEFAEAVITGSFLTPDDLVFEKLPRVEDRPSTKQKQF